MKLYRQEITFNVVEMIGSILDVSALQIERHKDSIKGGLCQWTDLCVTSFSFGRQSGHTCGAVEYLYRNPSAYLIVYNEANRRMIVANHTGLNERICSASQSIEAFKLKFKGKHNFDLIIDSVPEEQYQRFIMNVDEHVYNIRAVCRVGS